MGSHTSLLSALHEALCQLSDAADLHKADVDLCLLHCSCGRAHLVMRGAEGSPEPFQHQVNAIAEQLDLALYGVQVLGQPLAIMVEPLPALADLGLPANVCTQPFTP